MRQAVKNLLLYLGLLLGSWLIFLLVGFSIYAFFHLIME